eukprot:10896445-Prorocentrum_lima.AAC.1
MTSSLVGSEMCIRDRVVAEHGRATLRKRLGRTQKHLQQARMTAHAYRPVSYTHLTLPTICSV